MAYDSLSPKGEQSFVNAEKAIAIWHDHFPSWQILQTRKPEPPRSPAIADGVIVENGIIRGIIEIKSRSFDLYALQNKFKNEVIITHDKLIKCQQIAQALDVPFILFIYLVPDEALVWKPIWRPESEEHWNTEITIKYTETQKSVNGGTIMRHNTFVNMTSASIWRRKYGPEQTNIGTVSDSSS